MVMDISLVLISIINSIVWISLERIFPLIITHSMCKLPNNTRITSVWSKYIHQMSSELKIHNSSLYQRSSTSFDMQCRHHADVFQAHYIWRKNSLRSTFFNWAHLSGFRKDQWVGTKESYRKSSDHIVKIILYPGRSICLWVLKLQIQSICALSIACKS